MKGIYVNFSYMKIFLESETLGPGGAQKAHDFGHTCACLI